MDNTKFQIDMCMKHGIMFTDGECPICRAHQTLEQQASFFDATPDDWRKDFWRGASYGFRMAMLILGKNNSVEISDSLPAKKSNGATRKTKRKEHLISETPIENGATCSLGGG